MGWSVLRIDVCPGMRLGIHSRHPHALERMGRGAEHMRKQTVAVWVLAAVLSFGTATISALAAEGWAQSGSLSLIHIFLYHIP